MKRYRFKAKGTADGHNKFTVSGEVTLADGEWDVTAAVVATVRRLTPEAQVNQITLRQVKSGRTRQ
jgi:hypothetical protein